MGFFGDTTFEEGRKLYYHDAKAGIKMMEEAEDKSAAEMKTLAYKCSESNDEAGYKKWMAERAKKMAK